MADTRRRAPAKKAGPRKAITTHTVQAEVEGVPPPTTGEVVDDGRKVEFMGSWFGMAGSVGLMPLLQFAHASKQGLDSTDMEGLAALYAMIRDCIDQTRPQKVGPGGDLVDDGPSEWDRFQRHAIDTKAEADDLMGVVQKCIEVIAARPSRPPGGSSAGRQITSASSKASSSSPATRRPPMDGMVSPDDLMGRST